MMAHHGGENFLGEFEIDRSKLPRDGRRELGQVDQRGQQFVVFLNVIAEPSFDALSALFGFNNHEIARSACRGNLQW